MDDFLVCKPVRYVSLRAELHARTEGGCRVNITLQAEPAFAECEPHTAFHSVLNLTNSTKLCDVLDENIVRARRHYTENEITRSKDFWQFGAANLVLQKGTRVEQWI